MPDTGAENLVSVNCPWRISRSISTRIRQDLAVPADGDAVGIRGSRLGALNDALRGDYEASSVTRR